MQSEIVLFDLVTGTETVLLAHDGHIEAPNWTPDGAALIVNGGGRIFRVPVDAPVLDAVDTGFATRCNNDHGVSPDGRWLVISDSSQDGRSAIYTLPIDGGTPRRITAKTPVLLARLVPGRSDPDLHGKPWRGLSDPHGPRIGW